jgi:hypothetical protein
MSLNSPALGPSNCTPHRPSTTSGLQAFCKARQVGGATGAPNPYPSLNPIQSSPFQSNQPESARISRLRDTTYTQTEIASLARLGRSSTQHSTAQHPNHARLPSTPRPTLSCIHPCIQLASHFPQPRHHTRTCARQHSRFK